jgi:hypothetical protein
MEEAMVDPELRRIQETVETLSWYHTVDLGNGVVTPGLCDHRPYPGSYGLPRDLSDKTALDIGAASGFFAFEMEKRGAEVTATDLPTWGGIERADWSCRLWVETSEKPGGDLQENEVSSVRAEASHIWTKCGHKDQTARPKYG